MGNELNVNESLLNEYKNAISAFENKYRKDHYHINNPFNSPLKGYLIYLKDYERIYQSIQNIKTNNVDINKYKQSLKINQIEFNLLNFSYLINGYNYKILKQHII